MAVLFPDIEKVLVASLKASLASSGKAVANGVRVGTEKLPSSSSRPSKQVVIVGSYNQTLDPVRRTATATVEVYADKYADASSLGLLVAALIVDCTGADIKQASVTLGPVRLVEESTQEKRSMSVELVVKGSAL